MILVVLAAHASSAARSIVHSHQDSFGHQLEVVGRTADVPGRLDIACACGWRGSVRAGDVDLDEIDRGLQRLPPHAVRACRPRAGTDGRRARARSAGSADACRAAGVGSATPSG